MISQLPVEITFYSNLIHHRKQVSFLTMKSPGITWDG